MTIILGLAVMPLDFIVSFRVATLTPGFSHAAQFMSELAVSGMPLATAMSAWWIAYGTVLVLMGMVIRREQKSRELPLPRAYSTIVVIVGSCLGIGTGFFPCDPDCAGETMSAKIHETLGLVGCVALAMGPWLTRRSHFVNPVLVWLLPILFGLQLASAIPSAELQPLRGAIQRTFLLTGYVWISMGALTALKSSASRSAAA